MAKIVTEAELELPTGKAKHAKLLARFVEQQGAAALPVLERCITEGSKAMRATGWGLLAALDTPRAERHALAQAEAGAGKKKKERDAALAGLLEVATSPCLTRWEELSGRELDITDLDGAPLERASGFLHDKFRSRGVDWALGVLDTFRRYTRRPPLAFFRALLDERSVPQPARDTIAAALIDHGDLETCRRDDLSLEQQLAGAFKLPPAECFDRLAPRVRDDAAKLREIAWRLQHAVDPRWVSVYQAHAGRDPALTELGLCHLPCPEAVGPLLELASPRAWDQRLKDMLFALGKTRDPRAAPLLMKWLPTAEGREAAPLLLTALNGCGRPEDIEAIEREARHGAAPKMFYDTAVNHIRSRSERT